MDRDKAIRAAKLTLGGMLEKKRHTTAVSRADGQIAPSKYLPNVPRAVHADGGKVAFQEGNHPEVPDVMYHGTGAEKDFSSFSMPGNKTGRKTGGNAIYLSTSPDTAGTFANYGAKPRIMPMHVSAKNPFDFRNSDHIDALQGALTKNFKSWFPGAMYGPQTAVNWMRGGDFGLLENNNVRSWMKRQGHDSYFVTEGEGKPLNLAVFDPKQVKSAISNNGNFDPTDPNITKAEGGAANAPMFQGVHPSLQGESGAPLDLYHGTTQDKEFEAFDNSKLGVRDVGFFGRGHYMTPHRDTAQLYAGANEDDGTVIGPLHAALKNPYVWDVSDDMKSQGTLRDLQSMGIMRDKNELRSWDNLQQHHIQPFMAEMKKRGHDGVVVKTGHEHLPNGIAEVVAFDPKTIKHTKAEAFDPTDPRIRREDGGAVTDTDEFRNWFGNSVTHTNGDPHVLYTGTSKDKDFTSHNVGRHGAWFVRDPEAASSYAEQNDSQGYKREGFKLTPTNTASRVIPAYVRAENPYTGELPEEYLRDNYKAAQSEWFDTLRANGHDSWVPASQNGNLVVALKEPQQIKSIFNSGKFDPNQKHMNKATGGPVMGYVPMATLPTRRLINAPIQQQQPQGSVGTFSQSLNSLMDTVEGFKKKPEEEAATTETALTGTIPLPEQGYQASGMYAPFQSAIDRMIADAPGKISVASGYRTPQRQEELWNEAAAKYPDPELRDNYVARAGQSSHNYGLAADLSYADEAALKWAQENAAKYGLNFRMGHEDWHIEPANIWDLRKAMTVQGYADGGSVMDDNNNVTDLSTVRAKNDATSSDHTYGAKNLFSDLASQYEESKKAFDMAYSSGAFDNFQLGDTFKSKTSPNADPIKVVGFTAAPVERYPQATKLFNNHYPVLQMEVQNSDRKTYPTSLENFENNLHKYDHIAGKPRLVKNGGGSVDDDIPNIKNPMSVFPKPQRMFPEDQRPAGGQYLSAHNKADVTGHKAESASIGIGPNGKPFFQASQNAVDQTGTSGRGSATVKTNLFKKKAGWKWEDTPEGHENTDTIVSVEHRGKHTYALNAHFPRGVDLARYENSPSEPRLRPTTQGNVTLGPQAGSINVRGKSHPVYHHVIVKAGGGEVDQQNGDMENDTTPNNLTARPQAGGLPIAGGIRGGAGVLQTQNEAPLEGLPQKVGIPLTGGSVSAGPDPRIRQVARDYMASTGMQYNPPTKYVKADPSRARRIGAAYEAMKDDPNEPLTKASYAAMINETMAQYNAAKKAGLKVEFWNPEKQADPYGASPRLATEDVRNNHHMWVYPTYAGYGSGDPISEDDAKKNPLLQLTGETWNGIPVTVNDVFRAIHDYYGHAKEGVGFRADGEENAWRAHASMFSPLARMAMTSETRGQNSWLNYGPHGEKNRTARTEDTVFAPQKIGVLPHWAHHEGAEDFTLPEDVDAMHRIRSNFDPVVSKALSLTREFTKDGKSAISNIKPKGK